RGRPAREPPEDRVTPLALFLDDAEPLVQSARGAFTRGDRDALAASLQALALDAAAVVMPELAALSTAAMRAGLRGAEGLEPALAAIEAALHALANADESGARYDAARLRGLADALEGSAEPAPLPLP